jgi:glycosyltransferase involved in cell wall biosynthesis
MRLIIENFQVLFFKDVIREFEHSLFSTGKFEIIELKKHLLNKILWKILKSLKIKKSLVLRGKNEYLTICMGIWELWKCLPFFLFAKKKYIYLFDAWLKYHNMLESIIKILDIDIIFFSSQQAQEIFNQKNLKTRCIWIPEGVDINQYYYEDYDNKNIDVLCFGRKWEWYHNKIQQTLLQAKKSYLFETSWGNLIFKNVADFRHGLARTKISICIPKNITHPSIAGIISTMTNRYLQSFASKCLIVGIMPDEMKKIFDYNPIIEIDKKNPATQLISILCNYEKYIPLIEKNYTTVSQHHTWKNRVDDIISHIDN